jgi:hypothetical protein
LARCSGGLGGSTIACPDETAISGNSTVIEGTPLPRRSNEFSSSR